jgi:hypothetical protein
LKPQAEEMIKQEMVLMLHHDALVAPADNQVVVKKGQNVVHNEQKHFSFLDQHPYDDITAEDMDKV